MNKTILAVIICFVCSISINAQNIYSLFSFKDLGIAAKNIGTMVHDGESYSTDVPNIRLDLFNANTEADAHNRITTGSFGCYQPDLSQWTDGTFIREFPIIMSLDVINEAGSDNDNRPKYIVLASHDGSEFSFQSMWVWDEIPCEPVIRVEGFKDGVSTGSVLLSRTFPAEWRKTFSPSDFPIDKFGNVDEIRISRGTDDQWTGNNIGFNNFGIGTPILPPSIAVSKSSISITDGVNNAVTIDITSNTSWTASSNESWLTVSPDKGKNNGTITLTAISNSTATKRTATITIAGTGVTDDKTITVTQEKSIVSNISSTKNIEVEIYPNPVINKLYVTDISSFDPQKNIIFEIKDANGKLINKGILDNYNGIDVQSLTKGWYIFTIRCGDKMNSMKFIKR